MEPNTPANLDVSTKMNRPHEVIALTWRTVVAFLIAVAWADIAVAASPYAFDAEVAPFFATYCNRCHDDEVQKGDFRLDTLSKDFTSQAEAERWNEIRFRLNTGEMPPEEKRQPKAGELAKVVEWISARLAESEAARMAKRSPVSYYRLSREEYANTVQDLLGVHYDPTVPGALNEDPRWHGFERIGSMLTLSPSHIQRYLKAAEEIVEAAFPEQKEVPGLSGYDPNKRKEKWLEEKGLKGPVRTLFWPNRRTGPGPPRYGAGIVIDKPGLYRLRMRLSGLQPPGGPLPHLTIWHTELRLPVYDADILAPEDEPITLEWMQSLSAGTYAFWNNMPGFQTAGNQAYNGLISRRNVFTSSLELGHFNPAGHKLFDDNRGAIFPLLIMDAVEWEGPLVTEDARKMREEAWPKGVVVSLPPQPKVRGKPVVPPLITPLNMEEAKASLQRFASRAWRRPATDLEIDRYLKVIEGELASGESPAGAYRAALVGVLTSKNFFYLPEGSIEERRNRVNDWELASRLSYLLWGSMPDEALFDAASAGNLHDPQVIRAQFARMLADEKVSRFTDAFPQQWLQLHRVGMAAPDPKLYPDYDAWLERSMVLETKGYFEVMLRENRSLREFLVSDWTVLNSRLARHYDLPATKGTDFEKVKLGPGDHRGGLLTQASILSLTSDGTRHRPVHRGVWISEAIYGWTPPPPPPNVEPLVPTPLNEPKATIRQQVEAHATNAVCASCHRKIDPLGFAFDNFDAVGSWRMEEQVNGGKGENPLVDASGVLPDGRAFVGPEEFKALLAADLDRFAEAFVGQLATFALRRAMTVDDFPHIKAIAVAAKADDYPLATILDGLVTSELFLKR
jgi:cytochrome c553